VVCLDEGKILTVALEDPLLKITRLFPPGGKIEEGEEPWQTASRETYEETGYQVRIDPAHKVEVDYDFFWCGTHVPCHSWFFFAKLLTSTRQPIVDVSYNLGVIWVPLEQFEETFSYHPRLRETMANLMQLYGHR
jgi:8-oxo-dGTP pyrophosphatase MutT (NUDIX family)